VVAIFPGARPDEELEVLLGRRPARIIRLAVDPRAAPASAAVSGRCSPGTLERGVCLEEIDLAAAGDPLGSGAGAWTPLVARDIPTFLWIAGPWTPGPDLPLEAAAHADKLIVDSSAAGDPVAVLAALHRLRRATRGRLAVADLAWSRTLPLRVQAARAFDPPGARDALDELAEVRLEGATRSEALLFFLWLAARLDWQASAARGGPSFRDAAGWPVAAVHEAPAALAQGARLSFAARAGSCIEVACTVNGCAAIGDDRGPWRIAPEGELLLAEVDTLKQDALLDDALGIAAGIAEAPAAPATAGAGGEGL
jgi:glucose-6-phosphate dehydrogenase assembly protein OpcA